MKTLVHTSLDDLKKNIIHFEPENDLFTKPIDDIEFLINKHVGNKTKIVAIISSKGAILISKIKNCSLIPDPESY